MFIKKIKNIGTITNYYSDLHKKLPLPVWFLKLLSDLTAIICQNEKSNKFICLYFHILKKYFFI